jgi:hypothetical protein
MVSVPAVTVARSAFSQDADATSVDSDSEHAVNPNARAIDTANISDFFFCTFSPFPGVSNTRKGY